MSTAKQKFADQVNATLGFLQARAGVKFSARKLAGIFHCSEPAARRRLEAAANANSNVVYTAGRVGKRGPASYVYFWKA